jgi:hypothetical protein
MKDTKTDKYGYIGIETLLNFCENSKDHVITPNDFMRMERTRVPGDSISKRMVIDHLKRRLYETALNNVGNVGNSDVIYQEIADNRIDIWLNELEGINDISEA